MSDYQSDAINELATALAKAQARIANASKDGENPHFRSAYATLASVWDACRAPLSENGLSVVQAMTEGEKGAVLVTTLAHSSGQWMRSRYPVIPTKNDPQGLGSALTYARRYSLAAMVGVSPADDQEDDGERASGRGPSRTDSIPREPKREVFVPDEPPRQSRPAEKKGDAISSAPLTAKDSVPLSIRVAVPPFQNLGDTRLCDMEDADLELIAEHAPRARGVWAQRPNVSENALTKLMDLERIAGTILDERHGGAA